jgi:peptidoglycan hydrolase-like protein with peptidoglycan-binding domain
MNHLSPHRRHVAQVRDNRSAPAARAGFAVLIAVSLLLALPASSPAASAGSGEPAAGHGARTQATGSPATVVMVRGTGYGVRHGSRDVRELQRSLSELGHEPGPIDGLYGPRTEGAVVRFQLARGLAADGVVGPQTQTALQRPRSGPDPVRTLQRELRELGHEPGPIDGLYGPRTERAVVRFQRAQGLAADGVADSRTRRLLVAELRERRVDREPQAPAFTGTGVVAAAPAAPSEISPGHVALLAALALALLLAVRWLLAGPLRGRKRRDRAAPASASASMAPASVPTPHAGMALAFLLGVFVIGAACGALFASEAAPDRRAQLQVEPLRADFDAPSSESAGP